MSTAEQWASALSGGGSGGFTLKFDGMGLEAACRPLGAEEVEECRRMGGERGMRYALYLACDELRQAGEQLRQQGGAPSAFAITERLRYGDVMAAGAAILERSGAREAQVSLWDEGTEQQLFLPGAFFPEEREPAAERNDWRSGDPAAWPDDDRWARDFADRLQAASGNR